MSIKAQQVGKALRDRMPASARHAITGVTNLSDDTVAVMVVSQRHVTTVSAAALESGYAVTEKFEMVYIRPREEVK